MPTFEKNVDRFCDWATTVTSDETPPRRLSLLSLLFLLFTYLKLTGSIAWSWWWVTAPLWAPVGAVFVCVPLILVWAWWAAD